MLRTYIDPKVYEKGKAEGKAEGIAEGIAEGEIKGRAEGNKEILDMIASGHTLEQIKALLQDKLNS